MRLLPRAPAFPNGFLLVSNATVQLSSVAGTCGTTLTFQGVAASPTLALSVAPGSLNFRPCAGTSSIYELDGSGGGFLDDLSLADTHIPMSGAAGAQQVHGSPGSWTITALRTSLFTGGVVNAASLTGDIAPGGIVSIFGAGLANSTVTVNGESAAILASFPFQINAQIPFDIPSGTAAFVISSGTGNATAQASISGVAPEIFTLSSTQPAITNQDNTLNTVSNPALRGSTIVIYGTGFGAVGSSSGLSPVRTALSVFISGTQLTPSFAGLTPGALGLYQVNVVVPPTLPPGLSLPLYLKQGAASSQPVTIAVQ